MWSHLEIESLQIEWVSWYILDMGGGPKSNDWCPYKKAMWWHKVGGTQLHGFKKNYKHGCSCKHNGTALLIFFNQKGQPHVSGRETRYLQSLLWCQDTWRAKVSWPSREDSLGLETGGLPPWPPWAGLVEAGGRWPQAKDPKGCSRPLQSAFQERAWLCPHLYFWLWASRSGREYVAVVFSHPIHGVLLWQPEKVNPTWTQWENWSRTYIYF